MQSPEYEPHRELLNDFSHLCDLIRVAAMNEPPEINKAVRRILTEALEGVFSEQQARRDKRDREIEQFESACQEVAVN